MSQPSLIERLAILADAAKYDASCASSGTSRRTSKGGKGIGSTEGMGICHAYTPDGRCISLLKIKVSSRDQLVKNLSGGNQQKVIIARWLATQPDLLILDEPTRGIDVGTKTEIQKMAIALAKKRGMSVIFISSEMDEMVRTCTKLVVMRDRRKVAELTGGDISSDSVMKAIAGGAA